MINKNCLRVLVLVLILVGCAGLLMKPVKAQQTSLGIGVMLPILDEVVTDGSVVCMLDEGLRLCDTPYDHRMFGVVTDTPAAYFDTVGDQGRYIVSSGKSSVRAIGPISPGDVLTSSENPGVVMVAEKAGYILGTALDAVESGEATIAVAVNIRYDSSLARHRTNLVEMLRQSMAAPLMQPIESFRYLLAAILVVVAFGMGFFYYGRIANTGVEAIGRNPLAQRSIQSDVLLNLGATMLIVLVGLGAAYLVLIL